MQSHTSPRPPNQAACGGKGVTTSVELVVVQSITADLGDITHIVCCEDHDQAFCGIQARGELVDPEEAKVQCIDCVRKENRHYCPIFNTCAY